jgi:predicted MPP superfamily phosphohydrolase
MSIIAILLRMAVSGALYFLPDLFLHGAIRKAFHKNPRRAVRIYWWINVSIFSLAGAGMVLSRYIDGDLIRFNLYMLGLFVSFLFAKIIAGLVLLGEDLFRLPYSIVSRNKRKTVDPTAGRWISRRSFISRAAIVAGMIPFSGFIYGMIRGRYNFTIKREVLFFEDLPKIFDGITITQISDLHIGNWDHASKQELEYLVEMIGSLNSDLLLFTGDLVNSRADEMNGWLETFQKLTARLGKFSVLGNHDYGDYVNWDSAAEQEENLRQVKLIHPALGFRLLLNEHAVIEAEGNKLAIIGVENWGTGGFQQFGDIGKATSGLQGDEFRILLSHDPSHWDAVVLKEQHPPHLTLSGHTHGFQMGIETPGFRFSPSQWVYEQWAGLYKKGKHSIYVNRGLGTVGYPGRLGIWPEVTHLTLKRK